MESSFLQDIQWRGLLQDTTPETDALLGSGPVRAYIGFDPTAPSLTLGNLASLMTLVHLQRHGHQAVALLGGATGRIGDPSGKDEERQLLQPEVLETNTGHIARQIRHVLEATQGNGSPPLLLNNYDWFQHIGFLDFLRDAGKHLTLSYMLSKESVRRRMESGISFTEFAYQLLQAYDFYYLYREHGVQLQMGGSDQWGNMTAGIELIRRKHRHDASVAALTTPLLTRSDGTKFGKSAGRNLWLSQELTSPYQFYQFWINCTDEEARRYVGVFSLRPRDELEQAIADHQAAPQHRSLQRLLAREVTARVHTQEAVEKAEQASEILFGHSTTEALRTLDERTLLDAFEGVPRHKLSRQTLEEGLQVLSLVAEQTQVCESKGEARRMLKQNALAVNKVKRRDENERITTEDLIGGKYLLVQKGKRNYHLVEVA
jgi:tyrosyl-tRNA synthetase